jgi:hypothetical protein
MSGVAEETAERRVSSMLICKRRCLSDVDFECSRFAYIDLIDRKSDAKVRIDVVVPGTTLSVCLKNFYEFKTWEQRQTECARTVPLCRDFVSCIASFSVLRDWVLVV